MEWIDIVTAIIAIMILALVVWRQIARYKKSAGSGCQGGCGGCQWSDQCSSHAQDEKKEK
ncbi:MAG: FeoB-associated Cys-rich membrane protein [Epulopiscium sp.]|nr:FeoB-associated Cys-rich membrane protein [Candidatus Epulonipiscium sp.]